MKQHDSEHKQAEIALRQSQERYQSLFDNSPIPLWEEDFSEVKKHIEALQREGLRDFRQYWKEHPDELKECAQLARVIDINSAALKLHDANSREEILNGLPAIFTDKSYEAFKEQLLAISEGRLECEVEGCVGTLTGREKEVLVRWLVVPGHEDTLDRVYVSTTDITEQKRAQARERESDRRYSAIFESDVVGVLFSDVHGKIQDCNDVFLEMVGYSRDDVRAGKLRWDEITPPELMWKDAAALDEIKEKGVCSPYEKEYIRKDGTRIHVIFGAASLEKGSGTAVGVVLDNTERKQVEEKLEEHRENLEEEVRKRTADLENTIDLMAGREIRMRELKQTIRSLSEQLRAAGIEPVVGDASTGSAS